MKVFAASNVAPVSVDAKPAFENLYEDHVERVWAFLQRLGVPDSWVDDATQETFLIAHRQLSAFRGDSTVRTWLLGIALRVAKDHRRRESRRGGPWVQLAGSLPDDRRSPDDVTSIREELSLALRLLDQLDPNQRTVFVLVEFEGFTAVEVAALTSTNVNTVSTRLRAARLRFNSLVAALEPR